MHQESSAATAPERMSEHTTPAEPSVDLGSLRWVVDNDPSPRYPLYTRANIGEVFPTVVMPFSWTLWGIPHAEPGWCKAFVNLGAFDTAEFTDGEMEMLGVFGGYGYLNVSASRIFGLRTPGLTPEAVDQSFFGEQPDVPAFTPRLGDMSEKHTAQMAETLNWVFTATDLPDLLETRAEVETVRAARPALDTLSDKALLAHVRTLCTERWEALWVRHIMATYHATIPSGVIGATCAAVGKPELAADIMSGIGDVDSALPAQALWKLAREVAASPALTTHFDAGSQELPERLKADTRPDVAAFTKHFDAFLGTFGFHGPNEWEMRSRCWELDPATPLAAIEQMRRAPESESPAARAAGRKAAREEALVTVRGLLAGDAEALGTFNAGVGAAKVFFAGRERTKANCAMLTHEMRMAMWELGRRMTQRGLFTHADEFALLTDDEWTALLDGRLDTPTVLARRRLEETALAGLEPPFIVDGTVPPLTTWKKREQQARTIAPGMVMTGQPGCAGQAEGIARIVHDPGEPGDMEPGDILIAEFTDPSWTPLFSAAGGVVVNVGATVSHAVIVARELGVPCAVSVTGATHSIPDGTRVQVDGGAGTVTILALPEGYPPESEGAKA